MRAVLRLLLLYLCLGAFAASAQDDRVPILVVLASVPDTPESRATFSYADYAAIMGEAEGDDRFPPLLQVYSGPSLAYASLRLEEQERLIGVPFFAIEQAASWGLPPGMVTVFQGAFEAEAVQAALEAREFTTSELNGLPLFCGAAGCDQGMRSNLEVREPGDPFGGELARQQPVLFVPLEGVNQLLSSALIETVELSSEVVAGEALSLADNPEVQAAVDAAALGGLLRQALFTDAEWIGPAPDGAKPLPPYRLAVLGEAQTEDRLSASVTLVYETLDEAEAAAAALETRLASYESVRVERPYADLLDERGIVATFSAVEDAETGLAVAQVVFSGPDDALGYRLLVQGLYNRDLGWLGMD
ncbi:MAG: hypothetical protein JNL34_14780 [Anaerolineae bacterium]|nr:hypothetical protein [Anaerolineae bacterium]